MEIGHLKEFLNVLSVRAKSERNVGLTLKISALVTHYGDQFTLLTQVILYLFIFTLKKYWFSLPNRDSADGNEADHSQEFRYLHYYPARQPLKVSYLLNSEIVIEYLL